MVYAAWSLIISVIGDASDVVFGTADAGRSFELVGRDSMAGYFSNVVPIRILMESNQTFAELVQSIHQKNFGQQHNHFPTGDIQACSQLDGHQALFETLLVYENLPSQDLCVAADGGIALTDFAGDITSTFPLTIVIKPGELWEIDFTYLDQLSGENVGTCLAVFASTLEQVCSSSEISTRDPTTRHLETTAESSRVVGAAYEVR